MRKYFTEYDYKHVNIFFLVNLKEFQKENLNTKLSSQIKNLKKKLKLIFKFKKDEILKKNIYFFNFKENKTENSFIEIMNLLVISFILKKLLNQLKLKRL
jgi:hypothetical protein